MVDEENVSVTKACIVEGLTLREDTLSLNTEENTENPTHHEKIGESIALDTTASHSAIYTKYTYSLGWFWWVPLIGERYDLKTQSKTFILFPAVNRDTYKEDQGKEVIKVSVDMDEKLYGF